MFNEGSQEIAGINRIKFSKFSANRRSGQIFPVNQKAIQFVETFSRNLTVLISGTGLFTCPGKPRLKKSLKNIFSV